MSKGQKMTSLERHTRIESVLYVGGSADDIARALLRARVAELRHVAAVLRSPSIPDGAFRSGVLLAVQRNQVEAIAAQLEERAQRLDTIVANWTPEQSSKVALGESALISTDGGATANQVLSSPGPNATTPLVDSIARAVNRG